jgi:hypothetical protein
MIKLSLKQAMNIYGLKTGAFIWAEENKEFLDEMVLTIERNEYLKKLFPKCSDDEK